MNPTNKLIIREVQKRGVLTAKQAQSEAGVSIDRCRRAMREMAAAGILHVAAWYIPSGQTHRIPVYGYGKKANAPRPQAMTLAERKKRYNRRKKINANRPD